MADESVQPLVYLEQGGEKVVVASGGKIDIETGGQILTNGTQGAALTAQLTTITHTAPSTPDYAVQDLTNSSGYGFVTKDEGNSVLSVIKNLQTRVGELESRLQALGLIA
jgi:adenylosuccinate synthase